MTINPQTGIIQWLPSGIGSIPVTVVATDTSGLVATLSYTLTVHTNVPPTISSTPPTAATAGAPFEYDIQADGNGDTVSYTLAQAPAGMTVDSQGRVTWSPTIADIGAQTVTIDVTSGGGLVTPQSFQLDVVPVVLDVVPVVLDVVPVVVDPQPAVIILMNPAATHATVNYSLGDGQYARSRPVRES